jgi:serine/threonine protein kinase/tetratricopeptide (TPR) repeat protein
LSVRQIGRFVIRHQIGSGGMGVVYRAEDTTLGRAVAVKVLPASLAKDTKARERLLSEAQAAASLDHPNICTVFEVGESPEGELYLVMALYEGQTLAARLAEGPLSPGQATDIAVQIAQGLVHAHEFGIVHRDVKPSNIFLTKGGLAKLLDFGVARHELDLQSTGTLLVGTPAYMAPEQLRNLRDLDGRTDAWALGVVYYEMLTGRRAFPADDIHALMQSIFFDEPPAFDRDELNAFERAVRGLLAKDRERRLTLQRFLAGPRPTTPADLGVITPPQSKSLVVLPFQNIPPDPDSDYFADGLTAEIIADLSQVPALRVTSRRSAMRYKNTDRPLRQIARELDVHYVLEGSVRRAGSGLRITVSLVDATADAEIWAGKYSGTIDEVFDIQERVALAVVNGLRVRLEAGVERAARSRSIADGEAFGLYLRARNAIWRFSPEAIRQAFTWLDEAQAIVGDNALIMATRANALWQLVNLGAGGAAELADATRIARRALELDAGSVSALRVLALLSGLQGDLPMTRRYLQKAIEADPVDPESLSAACFFAALTGRGDEAVVFGNRVTEVDPLYAFHWIGLALAYVSIGDDEGAVTSALRAFELDPGNAAVRAMGPLILFNRVDRDRLVNLLGQSPLLPGVGGYARLAPLTRAAVLGDRDAVLAQLTPEVAGFLGIGLHNAFYVAEILALVGEGTRSLEALRRAVTFGLGCYPLISEHSRCLASVRALPGFAPIAAEVEKAWRSNRG